MENQTQVQNNLKSNTEKKFQKIKILLYSEDFDFAQSFSLYFRKDYQKIITVNDKEIFLQIISFLKPDIIVLDINLSESLISLVQDLKYISSKSKIFIFTSHIISQQDLIKRLNKLVDKIFYQPIDLIEFNQLLSFYTTD
ncbi:MAG: hypothetical protein N3F03_04645 [Ignavibacteria bacterium]|nr:hypothetical protein [Ignavibacteria bacterium]